MESSAPKVRNGNAMDNNLIPHWNSSALLTIDMQNDFISGSSVITGTAEIIPALEQLLTAFRNSGKPVFHAVRSYSEDGSNAELCRRSRIKVGGAIVAPGSDGAKLHSALRLVDCADLPIPSPEAPFSKIAQHEYIFYKPRWSAFFRTKLDNRLRSLGVDTLVISGCNFPNCPMATLFDASSLDYRTVVSIDATSKLDYSGRVRAIGVGATCMASREIIAHLCPEG